MEGARFRQSWQGCYQQRTTSERLARMGGHHTSVCFRRRRVGLLTEEAKEYQLSTTSYSRCTCPLFSGADRCEPHADQPRPIQEPLL